jgi:hypothetical protein
LSLEDAIHVAWKVNPALAIQIGQRFSSEEAHRLLSNKVNTEPTKALSISEAVRYILNDINIKKDEINLKVSFGDSFSPKLF